MVQVNILSGRLAGTETVARRFPFQVGRSAHADLSLDEPGVWDQHFEIQFETGDGFYAMPHGEALITVNGEPTRKLRLRNGDRIEMGGAALQFWLGATRQRGLRFHEALVWTVYVLVTGLQLYLIGRLF